MAMALRALISRRPSILFSARAFATRPLPPLVRFRPLITLADRALARSAGGGGLGGWRCFSTSRTASSLNDPSPNWSNRPPKETILLDGCDFEHWLVVVDPPDPSLTRDDIIQNYIKTLAKVIGSEEEARFKIYSVSTKHYFAFGALVSEELSYKIKELPGVRWVLPDSYLDVKNKDYGGEPFINGEAVPYDPRYHEEWVRNNARANERNRRNDRPRNSDRSRNFERRRENMQNFQNRAPPPSPPPPMQSQDQGTNAVQSSNPPGGMHRPSGDFGGYQNQVPTYPGGNLNQSGNLPPRDGGMPVGGAYPPRGNAYPGPPNAYQGAPGGYQGPPNTNQGGVGAYQGNPNAYQGGNQDAYQGVAGGYPGTPNAPRGGPTGYQGPSQGGYGAPNASQGGYGAPNAPQGGRGGYQGAPYAASQGGSGGFQGAPYAPQGGGGPGGYQRPPSAPQGGGPGGFQGPPNAYQGGSYEGSGGSHADHSFQRDGGSTYQGRDIPGRDQ